MSEEISKGLKITWLIHTAVCIYYGFMYLFFWESLMGLSKWIYHDPVYPRYFGMTLIAVAIINMIALFKVKEWVKVKLYLQFVILLCGLYAIICIWALTLPITSEDITFTSINAATLLGFLAAFLYFYLQMRK